MVQELQQRLGAGEFDFDQIYRRRPKWLFGMPKKDAFFLKRCAVISFVISLQYLKKDDSFADKSTFSAFLNLQNAKKSCDLLKEKMLTFYSEISKWKKRMGPPLSELEFPIDGFYSFEHVKMMGQKEDVQIFVFRAKIGDENSSDSIFLYKYPEKENFNFKKKVIFFACVELENNILHLVPLIHLEHFFSKFSMYCIFCSSNFSGKTKYIHECNALKAKTRLCAQCHRALLQKNDEKSLMKFETFFCDSALSENVSIKCEKCNFKFESQNCFEKHKKFTCYKKYRCDYCSQVIKATRTKSRQQMIETHVCGQNVCYSCGSNFSNFCQCKFSEVKIPQEVGKLAVIKIQTYVLDDGGLNPFLASLFYEVERGVFHCKNFSDNRMTPLAIPEAKNKSYSLNIDLPFPKKVAVKFEGEVKKRDFEAFLLESLEHLYNSICLVSTADVDELSLIYLCLISCRIKVKIFRSKSILTHIFVPVTKTSFVRFENYSDLCKIYREKKRVNFLPQNINDYLERRRVNVTQEDLWSPLDTHEIRERKNHFFFTNKQRLKIFDFNCEARKYHVSESEIFLDAVVGVLKYAYILQHSLQNHIKEFKTMYLYSTPNFSIGAFFFNAAQLTSDYDSFFFVVPYSNGIVSYNASRAENMYAFYVSTKFPNTRSAWHPQGAFVISGTKYRTIIPDVLIQHEDGTISLRFYNSCFRHAHLKKDGICRDGERGRKYALSLGKKDPRKVFKDQIACVKKMFGAKLRDVKVMYHCNWQKMLKFSKIKKLFKEEYVPFPKKRLSCRDSLFPAASDVLEISFPSFGAEEEERDFEVEIIDNNSCFPMQAINNLFPKGRFQVVSGFDVHEKFSIDAQRIFFNGKEYKAAVFLITLLPPTAAEFGVLPYKRICDSRICYPICRSCAEKEPDIFMKGCMHTNKGRQITGSYISLDVQRAMKYGWQVVKIYEAYLYEETEIPPYAEFIRFVLREKIKVSGFPATITQDKQKRAYINEINFHMQLKGGMKLEETDIKKDEAVKDMLKKGLNSMLGFFAINPKNSSFRHEIIYEVDKLRQLFENEKRTNNFVHNVNILSGSALEATTQQKIFASHKVGRSSLVHYSFICGFARNMMFDAICKLKEDDKVRVLRFDSDSIIIRKPRAKNWTSNLPIHPTLPGFWKVEAKGDSYCTLGSKLYCVSSPHSEIIRASGIKQVVDAKENLTLDTFIELYEAYLQGRDISKVIVQHKIYKNNETLQLELRRSLCSLRSEVKLLRIVSAIKQKGQRVKTFPIGTKKAQFPRRNFISKRKSLSPPLANAKKFKT